MSWPGMSSYSNPSPKEVADWHFHAWVDLSIPVHAQHQLAQMKGTRRVDREPNMSDGSSALEVCKCRRRKCLYLNGIRVPAGDVAALEGAMDSRTSLMVERLAMRAARPWQKSKTEQRTSGTIAIRKNIADYVRTRDKHG